ncbi:hypothetical protein [Serratia liquefaciens]|uniref:hypothetical protein n=1 Tax=Serratia liquefaciens TaxID=614 RepID=UPI0021842757|nr:hypothetical protein [Serratia liquefaciens]CAI2418715.1 Uncharacterised protein [Serratia liquefaciens]
MAQLTVAVECKYPTDEEINAVFKAVETEFLGRPFTGENVAEFMEEVRSRVLAMVEVVVSNTTQSCLAGIDGARITNHRFNV